jgi:hypothetical protein
MRAQLIFGIWYLVIGSWLVWKIEVILPVPDSEIAYGQVLNTKYLPISVISCEICFL